MDYNCRDIPMRLDIRYQPLNFEIYLSQVIEVPRTSLDSQPYDFQLEVEALRTVDRIIEESQRENEQLTRHIENENCLQNHHLQQEQTPSIPLTENISQPQISPNVLVSSSNNNIAPPSCPTETPLTPIKTTFSQQLNQSATTNAQSSDGATVNQVNPSDFEDIHYNPFDHLELQTIDELRELDLVFQASYANQASGNQLQPTTNDNPATQSGPANTLTKSA